MKTKLILTSILFITLIVGISKADIPQVMNFQGKATDKQGSPLNGAYNITFRIYESATGGTAKWQETHSGLVISNGVFQVLLGSTTPINLPFDKDYFVSLEINTDGEMTPRTRLASVGYAYKAKEADIVSSVHIPFYISGLELEYATPQHIKASPGAVDIDGRVLATSTYSDLIDIQNDSNYIQGCNNPNPWIYVYVYNNNNKIAYILADKAPDKSDHTGATDGIKRYYIQDNVAYRCIGAVRTNAGTKAGSILKFFQRGNTIMWDVPVSITTTDTEANWVTVSCSAAIPAISTFGIFGAYINKSSAKPCFVLIRPNGSTWSTDNGNAIYLGIADGAIGGQRMSATDSSQQIQHYEDSGNDGLQLDVEGYYLNIR